MEELIRNYFLNLGYYVVRGIKYKYQGTDLTDIDIFLYGRSSSLTRERINVDIKNKKSPQALERILWANGLMKLLKFDKCIVATTDFRPLIHSFGQIHDTTILDGNFLSRLKTNQQFDRLTDEEFMLKLSEHKSFKEFPNKDWKNIYDGIKSKLLTELDFSGFNSLLPYLKYFIEKIIIDSRKREDATRMLYIVLSYLFIIIDFILKDIVFLEPSVREQKLSDGFKFGNLGKEGVDKIIAIAVQISDNRSANSINKALENPSVEILKDYFSKNENSKHLFSSAKQFESLCFKKVFVNPNQLDATLRGAVSVILDFCNVERRKFFDSFPSAQDLAAIKL